MKSRVLCLAATLLIGIPLSPYAYFQTPPSQTPEKPLYQPSGNEATVVGTIRVNGEVRGPAKIDMSADPLCEKLNESPTGDSLIANQQLLQNAFVYIKEGDALKNYRFEVPATEAVLEHKKCFFSPHVLGIRAGQELSIVNSDPTQHNTHPTPNLNPEWNQTQPPKGPPLRKTLARAEVMIAFRDNQHPWEKAYVGVLDHPFFAVTDEFGNYQIRGLPPGTYKLVVWHEVLGEQEVQIKVASGETRTADFILDAK
jgi:hypothetical protein